MLFYIFGLGLFLSWAVPLHFLPWVSWHNEVMAFAAVIWLAGGLLRSLNRHGARQQVKVPKLGWALLLLALIVVAQTLDGSISFIGDGWTLVFYLTLCLFSLVIGCNLGSVQIRDPVAQAFSDVLIKRLAWVLLVGGLFSTIVALTQVLNVWESVSWILRMPSLRRPGANLGQPNQLATLILFSVASLNYLFESRRISVVAALPVMGTLLIGLSITESRTGALSLFFMVVWWVTKYRHLSFRLSGRAVSIWVFLFGLCFWYWPLLLNIILTARLEDADEAMRLNTRVGTRLVVWPQLWQAVLQRPWFGWGLREVSEAHNAVVHAFAESEPFTYAHNIALDLAIGLGLPLALMLLVAAASWLLVRMRDTKDTISWYCLAMALPLAVHSLLEFPYAYAYLLVPVMLLVGVLEERQATPQTIRVPWLLALVTSAVMSAAMAWSVKEYIAVEEDFRIARFEAARIGSTPNEYDRPHIVLLTQMSALLEGARIEPSSGMSPERIELARKVAMRYPWPATLNRYALSLALNGNPDEAIRQLNVLRALHGIKNYTNIKKHWQALAKEKFPQLADLTLP